MACLKFKLSHFTFHKSNPIVLPNKHNNNKIQHHPTPIIQDSRAQRGDREHPFHAKTDLWRHPRAHFTDVIPHLGADMSGVEFQYPDLNWREQTGMMAILVAESGRNKGQLSNWAEALWYDVSGRTLGQRTYHLLGSISPSRHILGTQAARKKCISFTFNTPDAAKVHLSGWFFSF